MQYDLFQDDEIEALNIRLDNMQKSYSSLRRGIFARYDELNRTLMQIQSELQDVKQIYIGRKAELVPFFGEYIEVSK